MIQLKKILFLLRWYQPKIYDRRPNGNLNDLFEREKNIKHGSRSYYHKHASVLNLACEEREKKEEQR